LCLKGNAPVTGSPIYFKELSSERRFSENRVLKKDKVTNELVEIATHVKKTRKLLVVL